MKGLSRVDCSRCSAVDDYLCDDCHDAIGTAVIEAAKQFALNEKAIRQGKAHLGTRLSHMCAVEDAVDRMIAASEQEEVKGAEAFAERAWSGNS